jgi:HPt (histidine-containing phosphotransfer) domain-containing protein
MAPVRLPIFDSSVLSEFFAQQMHLVKGLVAEFEKNSATFVQVVDQAIQDGDLRRAQREAHALKTSAKLLGLARFAASLEAVERGARDSKIDGEVVGRLGHERTEALQAIQTHLTDGP